MIKPRMVYPLRFCPKSKDPFPPTPTPGILVKISAAPLGFLTVCKNGFVSFGQDVLLVLANSLKVKKMSSKYFSFEYFYYTKLASEFSR